MTTPSHPDWSSPTYGPPLPDADDAPAVRPLPPQFAGIQPEPYATLAQPAPAPPAAAPSVQWDPETEPPATVPAGATPYMTAAPATLHPHPAEQPAEQAQPERPAAEQPAQQPISDTAEVLGQRDVIELVSGTRVRVRKLRTMELMALMEIVLGGFAGKLHQLSLDPDEPGDVFMAKFGALLLTAFPGARKETMAFLREVCDPVGVVDVGPRELGSKAIRDRNDALKADLDRELANADFDDTLSIIEKTIELNAGDFKRWGKRLAGMWRLLSLAGRIPASPTSQG